MINATMAGLINRFIESSDLKNARELLARINNQVSEEGVDRNQVKRSIFREFSAKKKRSERQFALEASHARCFSSEVKREKKLDEASEKFYARNREIKALETLYRRCF